MSPKAANYKANSIVYFKGDLNERIYILKSGKVVLKYNDIETGQEMQDLIQTGEFIGVKSAMGKSPREETAVVLQDSAMVTFTVPEFEQVAMANTRIILKMLKVFSTQLRRIHKQVSNLLSTSEQLNPETGLYKIGDYYMNRRNYAQALYAFRRYLTYYPSGKYASDASENIQLAERYTQSSASAPSPSAAQAKTSPPPTSVPSIGGGTSQGKEMSDAAKEYYNAVSLFSQQKYDQALEEFKAIVNGAQDQEYGIKSLFEIGRCLFSLENYDACIKHFTTMIQKYPKHTELIDALYYLGICNEKNNDVKRADSFYKKILSMSTEDMPVHRKARKALRKLAGS
ncbi:MAG: tetratricopeptide repeat protein [Spirochaetales bacterium]|jgi:TolA-binding protein|nr:tetratricopeptide repeat protein [Spirochaetales bacterium]